MADIFQRKEKILLDIVNDYIDTVRPVSSGELLARRKYMCSSATIRNIMAELDEDGFLYQPHTSAGRVPTDKAYRFFVDKMELMPQGRNNAAYRKLMGEIQGVDNANPEEVSHMLASRAAELTGSMAFAGLVGLNRIYKEGLTRMLEEPEFSSAESIRSFLAYTERLERRINELCRQMRDDIYVAIGTDEEERQHPFSLMALTYRLPNSANRGFLGIAGPMRMHYSENFAFLDSMREFLNELYE